MENRFLERVGAAAGAAFVVLSLLSAFIYPQQPASSSSAATTLSWVHEHRVALQAGMIVAFFASGAFVWFAGYLRVLLRRAGDASELLSDIVFGAGLAVAVLSALAAVPTALLAFMDGQPAGIPDGTVVRMLGDLNTVLFATSSVMTGVFVLALGLSMIGRAIVSPWLGWLSLVVAGLNGVAVWIATTFNSYHGKEWDVVGWGAFIGFLLVVAVTSGALLRSRQAISRSVPTVAVS